MLVGELGGKGALRRPRQRQIDSIKIGLNGFSV
jgi:hypothetical protein